MVEFETTLLEAVPRAPGVKSFRFELKEAVSFKPGQFFLATIKIGGTLQAKHFSFSNSPTEPGYLEFTKRITSSPYSQALDNLNPGDWARLKLPYGSFTFEGEYEKVAFLSGGVGITPLRSMCKFATDRKLSADIVLLYGNSRPEDIIFRKDFDAMAALNKNLHITYTLTASDIDKTSWSGETGFIDAVMIKRVIPDYASRIFYLCGPPAMVASLKDILLGRLEIEKDKIRIENFIGY